jgi:hypothetical protein
MVLPAAIRAAYANDKRFEMGEEERLGHRLTDKDPTGGTAVCAVCGPVKMRSRGRGRQACANNLAARRRRWEERNPEKSQASRRWQSPHKLTAVDPSTRQGECPVCGPVTAVPKGRGWMCETRAKELWANQQEAPQSRCPKCTRAWLVADGSCPRCADGLNLSAELRKAQFNADEKHWVLDACDSNLDLVFDEAKYNPLSVLGEQVENPALKTLGAGVPEGRRAEQFIRDWWRKNRGVVEEGL